MQNNIFEEKSYAEIKFQINWKNFSEKINLFDKIYFEEKNNSYWWIDIRKKEWDFWNIKFPTNAENSCFLVAKEMQKLYAKKNKWTKPKSIIITIEKNIPLNSWLWWANSNAECVKFFLDKFWWINFFSDKKDLKLEKKFFKNKKIFILIPKYIFIEKKFFEKNVNIKKIFPDLEKFIKIFLDNWAEFSDISGKWSAVFWVFDDGISDEEIEDLKNIFVVNNDFWELIVV